MKSVSRIKYFTIEILELGFIGSLYRLIYEFALRFGFITARDTFIPRKIKKYHFTEWRSSRKTLFTDISPFILSDYLKNLPDNNKSKFLHRAEQSLSGNIRCFSHWQANYGQPINWHLNPRTGVSWPSDVHWIKAMRFPDGGDIKLVWEVNRFPHVYDLVRAHLLTNDPKYAKVFFRQVREWDQANPYPKGVNWASGQELAIRVLSWIFALYQFAENDAVTNEDFQVLLKQINLHAHHISRHIHYAYYAVHNNHLIGEALALYAVGTLFPFLPGAKKWKKRGRRILEGKALAQFYGDGGYCQLSHTYHRLALHYYLWAVRIAEVNGEPFPRKVYNTLKKSAYLLLQNMNMSDGSLPNWGNNDGALLNPWTSCDYTDFRPVVAAVYAVTANRRVFEPGPWDEEVLWLTGSLPEKLQPVAQVSSDFPQNGLHVLRKSYFDFVVFRCGTPPDRFGQADQLHVDIYFNGENIAPDGGSYLYNDELQYHTYFMGTRSHNTVTVDGQDQMLLWRRFKWLYKSKAKIEKWEPNNLYVKGQQFGYQRLDAGVIHQRELWWKGKTLVIRDEISNNLNRQHTFELHWNLAGEIEQFIRENGFYRGVFQTPTQKWHISIGCWVNGETVEPQWTIRNAFAGKNLVDGWISRYYGAKFGTSSVRFQVRSNRAVRFVTVFSPQKLTVKEMNEWMSS